VQLKFMHARRAYDSLNFGFQKIMRKVKEFAWDGQPIWFVYTSKVENMSTTSLLLSHFSIIRPENNHDQKLSAV
jgi:hypothetical protein